MKEFKGTKGKWKVSRYSSDELRVLDRNGTDVAILDGFMNGFSKSENKSNSKIIAAAPELLESVNELLSFCIFHGYAHSTEINNAEKLLNKIL